jgi:5-methylcytosine-specific restriction endonuclease McrA
MVPRSRVSDIVHNESPYKKTKIPKALREQVWLKCMGETFDGKCKVGWCKNRINVFDFQCGHNIPESKGGKTTLDNLLPICTRCNISMGSQYTIDEWNTKFAPPPVVEVKKVGCMIAALDRFRYKPSSQV